MWPPGRAYLHFPEKGVLLELAYLDPFIDSPEMFEGKGELF